MVKKARGGPKVNRGTVASSLATLYTWSMAQPHKTLPHASLRNDIPNFFLNQIMRCLLHEDMQVREKRGNLWLEYLIQGLENCLGEQ